MTLAELNRLIASFDWEEWEDGLREAFAPEFEAIALAQGEHEAGALAIEFDSKAPFLTRFFTKYIGERITQMSQSTRDMIVEELHAVLEHEDDRESAGATALAGQLSDAVADSAAFSPARSLMIARTETAIAYNVGALGAYHQAGVEKVEVSDGDEDEECADADGQIWTLEEALAEPVAHPNCVRSFAPVVDDEGEQDEEAA